MIDCKVLVYCDWAQNDAEQKIMREITWKLQELQTLVGTPLRMEVNRYGAASPNGNVLGKAKAVPC